MDQIVTTGENFLYVYLPAKVWLPDSCIYGIGYNLM